MVTFLTVLLRARGAAGPGDTLLLEAGLGEIGWLCIMTFFKGGEFLQKRTTGAGGKNSKGEPSLCVGSGSFFCFKEKNLVSKRVIGELHQENLQIVVPVPRGFNSHHQAFSATVPELS